MCSIPLPFFIITVSQWECLCLIFLRNIEWPETVSFFFLLRVLIVNESWEIKPSRDTRMFLVHYFRRRMIRHKIHFNFFITSEMVGNKIRILIVKYIFKKYIHNSVYDLFILAFLFSLVVLIYMRERKNFKHVSQIIIFFSIQLSASPGIMVVVASIRHKFSWWTVGEISGTKTLIQSEMR